MKSSQIFRKQAQAGFTLIELIVVIVILGILAATALPRMFDMSGQARLAKMQAALGAVKAAQATAHAAWLMNGGQLACAACSSSGGAQTSSAVTAEGQNIVMLGGYPDVGGDGLANTLTTAVGGMVTAANLNSNGSADYVLTTFGPLATDSTATATSLSIAADAAHPNCRITYTEASQTVTGAGVAPVVTVPAISSALLTTANCG